MKEMSDQVRGIIFVILVMAVIFAWSHFYTPPPVPPQKQPQTSSQKSAPAPSSSPATTPAASAKEQESVSAAAAPTVAKAADEVPIVVESALYRVQLSNRGAVVKSWKLKNYNDDQKPPQPLELVNADGSAQLGWPLSVVLSDQQLESRANSALYEVTPSDSNVPAPCEITFHWSDGHLEITKKLNFTQDYQTSLDVSASLDGRPIPVAVAWRGGFGDKSVYKASQNVTVFYKQNGKLNLLQYKKLGVSGNQSQPTELAGPMDFLGIEDQFFTATFLPSSGNVSLWDWTQDHKITVDNKPEYRARSGNGCWDCLCRTVAEPSLRRPEGPRHSRQAEAFARRARELRLDGRHCQALALHPAMASPLHSELGLDDHPPHRDHQLCFVPA